MDPVQSKLRNLALILLVLLFGLQIGLWFSSTGMRHLSSLDQAVEAQSIENTEQKLKNEQLEAEVQNLRDGLEAVEERARSELGLIGEGEVFYQVIEAPSQDGSSQEDESQPDE